MGGLEASSCNSSGKNKQAQVLHVGQEQARDLFLLQSLVDFQRLLDSDKSGAYKLADENTLSKGNLRWNRTTKKNSLLLWSLFDCNDLTHKVHRKWCRQREESQRRQFISIRSLHRSSPSLTICWRLFLGSAASRPQVVASP